MDAGTRQGRRASTGITLLELCFGLSILALAASLAAPGFHATLRASAMRAATFEVMAGLQRARANSIIESRPASFCPSDIAGNCLPASTPGSAWRASLDGNTGAPQAHDIRQGLPRGVQLHASRSPIHFWPTAYAASTGTLTICDTAGVARPRAIVISQTGRARLTDPPAGACEP